MRATAQRERVVGMMVECSSNVLYLGVLLNEGWIGLKNFECCNECDEV